MGVTILIRKGTKSELVSHGALQNGELAWITDEKKVYAGDGANNYLVGAVVSGTGSPAGNGIQGTLYVDTQNSTVYYSDGAGYSLVGSSDLGDMTGTLDDISDGSSYQRVAATEVDASGYVVRLNDGTYIVTASGAYSHLNDDTLHRIINDSGTSTDELWSASKINSELSALVYGVDWQESVIDKDLCEPPGSPNNGDRYIICSTASGVWASYSDYITEYITASGGWVYFEPNEGWASWVEDEDKIFVWNGSTWNQIAAAQLHNNLPDLQGGTTDQYYHLTSTQHTDLTDAGDSSLHYHSSDRNRANHTGTQLASTISDWGPAVQTTVSGMVESNTETGISVEVAAGKMNFIVAFSDSEPTATVSGGGSAGDSEDVSRGNHAHALGAHSLVSELHTVTGLTEGHILKALSPTTYNFSDTIDGGAL